MKALVERLAALRDVVFYVGAGASIERTGLTWDGLTAELLSAICRGHRQVNYLRPNDT